MRNDCRSALQFALGVVLGVVDYAMALVRTNYLLVSILFSQSSFIFPQAPFRYVVVKTDGTTCIYDVFAVSQTRELAINCGYQSTLTSAEVEWLALVAFERTLARKPALHAPVVRAVIIVCL